ncbi:AfsR/SARP family transcriptional regulator [Phytoactinopolyspora limicola]|uniref:AfsR/SARP family transcriptional regulator n=1 Tax=Phytoactinopolyspora limicola TaxID=2715536 RepID=UPI001408802E|nr:BTAD domain-containing putative transcriptional regulator [Phytoactinopolyspora limicola]
MTVLFRILGPVEIEAPDGTLILPRRRERCLLAVLLWELNRVVPASRLAELLWDGEPPTSARQTLRSHVSRVRASLSSLPLDESSVELVSVGGGYRMAAEPDLVDAHRFRMLVDRALALDHPFERVNRLRSALDLWRGPAVDNAASDWLRDRLFTDLEEQRLRAIERLTTDGLTMGCENVLPELARTVSTYPGHEHLAGLLMRALYQAGRKAEALDVYDRTRVYLAGELGLDPGRALRELHQSILRDELPAVRPAQRVARRLPVPQQLPAGVVGFTGRHTELEALDAMLTADPKSGAAAGLAVVTGTAGVGKTALVVHWARQVVSRFPDGQLYVNMRGFDVGGTPVRPPDALRSLLEALDVSPEQLPNTMDAQVGLYRSVVAGKRLLIVLDNVHEAEQVRPLLPGDSGCVVVVTSRNQLSGLVATEGAHRLALGLPSFRDARELLERRLGRASVAVEAEAADEIVTRCARLPLALTIMAARAAARPCFALRALADELRDPGGLLDACSDVGTAADIRTVFSGSVQALSPHAGRLLRLFSVHVGDDMSASAAASLAGMTVAAVRRSLTELARGNLIVEVRPGRFSMHGLLRAYAGELLRLVHGEDDVQQARRRLSDHYVHTAHAAALLLHPHRPPIGLPEPALGVLPESFGYQDALEWFLCEGDVLLAVVAQAVEEGASGVAWRLVWAAADVVERQGLWEVWAPVQVKALDATRRHGDLAGQANMHREVARVHVARRAFVEAAAHAISARDIFGELADRVGEARARIDVGLVMLEMGDADEALLQLRQGLLGCQAVEDEAGHAEALSMIGRLHATLGEHELALEHARSALTLQHQLGDAIGQVKTLECIGRSLRHTKEHTLAVSYYERALALARQQRDRHREVDILIQLGDVYVESGLTELVMETWQQAITVSEEIGRADIHDIRARSDEALFGSA